MVLSKLQKINKEYHFFNSIAKSIPKNKFIISAKDAICTKDLPTTAGSQILSNYVPRFDATVISNLKKEGGVVAGKTSQDAFGFGSFNVNVGNDKKIPLNPIDATRVCGGSSGGAAGFTRKLSELHPEIKHVALGESTGGSISCPAAFCGVVGLTPTYGRVSRYGLISYGNSLDKIGPMAMSVKECAKALDIIAGSDGKDSTCIDHEKGFESACGKDIKKLKIGIIKEGFGDGVDKEVVKSVQKAIKQLGVNADEVSLPLTMKYGIPVYYLLAMTEASTNLTKLSGLRYGQEENPSDISFNDYFTSIRTKYFNEETKRRILLGTFARMAGFRDAYYIKAAKIRTLIIEEYKELFKTFDVLITPTMPIIAPTFDEIKKLTPLQHYMMDILTVGPNLAGIPHITVPCGEVQGMPVGMQIMADHWQEKKMIQVADYYERKRDDR